MLIPRFGVFLFSLGAIYTAPVVSLILLAGDILFYLLVATENVPMVANYLLILAGISCLNMAVCHYSENLSHPYE